MFRMQTEGFFTLQTSFKSTCEWTRSYQCRQWLIPGTGGLMHNSEELLECGQNWWVKLAGCLSTGPAELGTKGQRGRDSGPIENWTPHIHIARQCRFLTQRIVTTCT